MQGGTATASPTCEAGGIICLAREPGFWIGALEVRPATLQLTGAVSRTTLEPRVMQVLVALARAKGAILTRDELIARCWAGRIVGENAIHRVISRLRRIATASGGAFEIETIAKVGYRLVVGGAPPERPAADASSSRPLLSRRVLLGGASASLAAAGAAGYFLLRGDDRHAPEPAALALYRRGQDAQRQGLREQNRQAVAYFRQAVEIDPLYALAWGALALGYRDIIAGAPDSEVARLTEWSRSAARRALALDPDNADAQAALALTGPIFRHWASAEADCRRLLLRYPDHWFLNLQLSRVLAETGRWREALQSARNVIRIDPFMPIGHVRLALALWATGRLQEAETALGGALARWPGHWAIWFTRFDFLLYGGRPAEARAFAAEAEGRPYGMPDGTYPAILAATRAVETRGRADIEVALGAYLAVVARSSVQTLSAVALAAALDRIDTAFALLDNYYFREGWFAPQPRPPLVTAPRCVTEVLFRAPNTALHPDPRFGRMLERMGLERYWRSTGTQPDYRR
ncbi:MAG TPA: winged helix-turn-helix domain-containing protein [Allosphingosinicella sp.]|nr:winged helix-turn-helix domain-containing protein [Allosphingosinicella sp.]